MIKQIRALQKEGGEFAIELASGRVVQVYDSWSVATDASKQFVGDKGGTIIVLHSGGGAKSKTVLRRI